MPDPSDLLGVARLLSNARSQASPSDAQLRRAVSTAYYALFHKILRAAARRFMGPNQEASAGYALLYRSFDHTHMKKVCEALQAPTLDKHFKRHLCRRAVSKDMRDFAAAFQIFQERRHLADYDPTAKFSPSEVSSLIDAASDAMDAFDRAAPDEQADVLALLMVRARS